MVWPAPSLLGHIHLIKMNILLRLLYLFQMLPVMVSKKAFTLLNRAIMKFIWCKKRPRLRYSFLSLPLKNGGLAAPSFSSYLWAAQFKFLLEWFIDDPDFYVAQLGVSFLRQHPLAEFIMCLSWESATLVKDNVLLKNMLNIWWKSGGWKGSITASLY